jgi:RHS repeat-associated protein
VDSPIGYAGNWTDPDTGLIYLRARDYDPATAQFMTVDPQVDSTHQPYAYVANDPLGSADPSGLCPSVMPNCLTPADFGGNSWFLSPGPMAVGDALNSPIGKSASTVFEGIGDGVTGGATQRARDALQSNAECFVSKDGSYYVGAGVGFVGSFLVPTDAAVTALGRISNASRISAAAAKLGGPTLAKINSLIPEGYNLNSWGRAIWGRGTEEAVTLTGARSASELSQIPGLTSSSAQLLRDYYVAAIRRGTGSSTAYARVDLLQDVINTLGG